MKIVHAASEMFPLIKTGGLADAVGALTKALAGFGHEVVTFLPGYRAVLEHPLFAKASKCLMIKVELGDEFLQADVYKLSMGKRQTLYVIKKDEFYDRSQPYGSEGRDYDDNDRRFIYFCKAVVEVLRLIDFKADVVHCHDWQTALLPVFLRMEERKRQDTLALKTVISIHNIAFQGVFPSKSFSLTNLPDDLIGIDGLEFYGQINMLKGGILFADNV
ncbi:MAG: glycogen/starch synthase, partial [Opitutaceae bacterium]|nr:glycogen/starch synthase [Opitutaceae bacterium]